MPMMLKCCHISTVEAHGKTSVKGTLARDFGLPFFIIKECSWSTDSTLVYFRI